MSSTNNTETLIFIWSWWIFQNVYLAVKKSTCTKANSLVQSILRRLQNPTEKWRKGIVDVPDARYITSSI